MATTTEARAIACPTCNALAHHPCTQPTDTGRIAVPWVHMAREVMLLSVDRQTQDFFLTFGVGYYDEPHPEWPECNPAGWVRITAPDYEQARAIAVERFGLHWSMLTPSVHFNPKFFPAGELMVLP